MPKKNLNVLCGILFLLSVLSSGCGARVIITDTEWCADAGHRGAFCFTSLTERRRTIPAEQWERERFGKLCTSAETLAEWKAAILKLCDDTGRCDYETKQQVESFGQNMERTVRQAVWTRF